MARKKVNREFILREALTLFRDNGYHATSMSDIGEACGLLKGSIYHYFPSKEKLMQEVISFLHEYYRHNAFRHALDDKLGTRQKLRMLGNFYQELFFGHEGGCLMANIAMETGNVVPAFSDPIQEFFREWIDSMAHIFRSELPEEEAMELARETVGLLEGSTMLMRVFDDKDYFRQALRSIYDKFERLSAARKAAGANGLLNGQENGLSAKGSSNGVDHAEQENPAGESDTTTI